MWEQRGSIPSSIKARCPGALTGTSSAHFGSSAQEKKEHLFNSQGRACTMRAVGEAWKLYDRSLRMNTW